MIRDLILLGYVQAANPSAFHLIGAFEALGYDVDPWSLELTRRPNATEDARAWIADCEWADVDSEQIEDLAQSQVWRGIERHFEGGIERFLRTR